MSVGENGTGPTSERTGLVDGKGNPLTRCESCLKPALQQQCKNCLNGVPVNQELLAVRREFLR